MNLTPDLQYLIEQYLNGQLKGQALQEFEEQLATDKALVQEVAFQRDLTEMLEDSPENALRKNLDLLNQQVAEPKESGNSWKFGLVLLPFLLLGVWWLFKPVAKEKTQSPQLAIDTLIYAEDPIETVGTSDPLGSTPPVALLAFEPNPVLTELLEKNKESPSFKLLMEHWQREYEITTLTDSLTIQFNSQIISDLSLLEKALQWHLFTNDPTQFDTFQPIASHSLDLQQVNQTTYRFNFQQTYLLPVGRYYVVIADTTPQTPYFVEQFIVDLTD